jgi:hypothetical protein
MELLQGGVKRCKEVWLELKRVFPLVWVVGAAAACCGGVVFSAIAAAVAIAGTGMKRAGAT